METEINTQILIFKYPVGCTIHQEILKKNIKGKQENTCKQLVLLETIHRIFLLIKDSISHNSTGQLVFSFFILISTVLVRIYPAKRFEKSKDVRFNAPKAQIKTQTMSHV